jgi:hypothetical protein
LGRARVEGFGLGLFWALKIQNLALITGLKIYKKLKSTTLLKGSIFGPVRLCPIFRPFGLGLRVLFRKKPKPDPPLFLFPPPSPINA